jgi:hypothetical protein
LQPDKLGLRSLQLWNKSGADGIGQRLKLLANGADAVRQGVDVSLGLRPEAVVGVNVWRASEAGDSIPSLSGEPVA